MPRGRASLLCLAPVVVALAGAPWVPLVPARGATAVPVIVITGAGWGHGVGMAQDGALEMGREGATLGQILGQFYPGTSLAQAHGDVRVPVLAASPGPGSLQITFPDGGQVVDTLSGQQSPGFPRPIPPGGSVVVSWDGSRYTATTSGAVGAAGLVAPAEAPTPTTTPGLLQLLTPTTKTPTTTRPRGPTSTAAPTQAPTTTRPSSTTRPPSTWVVSPAPASTVAAAAPPISSSRPLWAIPSPGGALGVPGRGRSYRGDIEAEAGTGALRLVNQLDVETYLTGMGEVLDPSWPAASLEAQEVAARTYALRAMSTSGELCDDTRCQVYIGTAGEYPAAEQAVAATAGEVLVSDGELADAVYSANAAGYSASREEGFGVTDAGYPYLRAAPYPAGPPLTWTTSVSAADAATLLGLTGPITGAAVTAKGPSGRALQVTMSAGGVQTVVSGLAFAAALDLRSTLISVRMGSAASAPPPPKATLALQLLPESAGAIAPPVAAALAPPVARVRSASSSGGVPDGLIALAALLVALTAAAAVRARRRTVS